MPPLHTCGGDPVLLDTACPRATPDVQILLLEMSLAEPKSKLFFLQDLSTLPQGRVENCAPNMELNREGTPSLGSRLSP